MPCSTACSTPRTQTFCAAAVRVLSDWSDPQTDLPDRIADKQSASLFRLAIDDEHPRVRLEAIRGVAKLGDANAAEIALASLNRESDRFLDYGLWLAVNELADPLMKTWKAASPA